MPGFELLAGCDPAPSCPKVVRVAPGRLVVVGAQVSPGSGTVSISVDLYRRALVTLPAIDTRALRMTGVLLVRGEPVTDAVQLGEFGVSPGEGAVRIGEAEFLDLALTVAAS
jgi:hypothetical protein